MKNLKTTLVAMAALVAGLGMASSAHAGWTFDTATVSSGSANLGTSGGISLIGTSYAAQNASTALNGDLAQNYNSGFASGARWFQDGTLSQNGVDSTTGKPYGLGDHSDGYQAPNHAFDNAGTNTEGLLMQFSSSVILNSITTGFSQYDSDFSVFRWTGSGAPTGAQSLTNLTADQTGKAGSGWTLLGNYNGVTGGDNNGGTTNLNNTTLGSSWWFVTAFNSAYGSGASNLNQGDDFFKLLAVNGGACTDKSAGNKCGNPPNSTVPEPTSLALVAIAGLGIIGARRRALKGSTAA